MSLSIQYLHVIGAFQGLLLAGLLILGNQISTASRILGVWCLLLSLSFLGPFVYMEGELNAFSDLIGLHLFLPAGYGALLFLYCRHAIVDRPLALKELWHFSPLLLCYLINIELYLSPPEVKLDAILNGPKDLMLIIIAQVIMAVQAFGYLAWSMIMVRRYQVQATQTLSDFNPDMFSWLWKLLILDLAIWTLKIMPFDPEYRYFRTAISDGLIIVLIYSIALAQWRNPQLFKIAQFNGSAKGQSNDTSAERVTAKETTNSEIDATSDISNYSGALTPETRSSLYIVVQQYMEEHQTFLDNQLTLTRLADAVGISTHHLSEVLNQHQGKNFYQFVNEYRIDFVCESLKLDADIKILDIAMEAGFSSKSTFNAVFKQIKGTTPTQFRNSLK